MPTLSPASSPRTRHTPSSLARCFALAAAGLAVGALLLTLLASWWLLSRQQDNAINELAARERQFHAQTVGLNLTALASRMTEIAGSAILVSGRLDNIDRDAYRAPFL